jgi:hypothetical protein
MFLVLSVVVMDVTLCLINIAEKFLIKIARACHGEAIRGRKRQRADTITDPLNEKI